MKHFRNGDLGSVYIFHSKFCHMCCCTWHLKMYICFVAFCDRLFCENVLGWMKIDSFCRCNIRFYSLNLTKCHQQIDWAARQWIQHLKIVHILIALIIVFVFFSIFFFFSLLNLFKFYYVTNYELLLRFMHHHIPHQKKKNYSIPSNTNFCMCMCIVFFFFSH